MRLAASLIVPNDSFQEARDCTEMAKPAAYYVQLLTDFAGYLQ